MRRGHLIFAALAVCACGGKEISPTAGPGGEAGAHGGPQGSAGAAGRPQGGPDACNENGVTYANGATWTCSDGCNACSCDNGKVASDLHGCPPENAEGGVSNNTQWIDGAACLPGSQREFTVMGDAGACAIECGCQADLRLQCTTTCPSPFFTFAPPDCTLGEKCSGGGCRTAAPGAPNDCETFCWCDGTGHNICSQACPNICGLPGQTFCRLCDTGEMDCEEFVLVDGACESKLCGGILQPI